MIMNLLFINLIVVLVFLSGFVEAIDGFVYKHFKPYHLGKPFNCSLCTCFWLSLGYILFAGKLSFLSVVLCLANAHLTEITTPLITLVKNLVLKIIEVINERLW